MRGIKSNPSLTFRRGNFFAQADEESGTFEKRALNSVVLQDAFPERTDGS